MCARAPRPVLHRWWWCPAARRSRPGFWQTEIQSGTGLGSGIVYDGNGYIMTNAHVCVPASGYRGMGVCQDDMTTTRPHPSPMDTAAVLGLGAGLTLLLDGRGAAGSGQD
jgi:hypothetical protein